MEELRLGGEGGGGLGGGEGKVRDFATSDGREEGWAGRMVGIHGWHPCMGFMNGSLGWYPWKPSMDGQDRILLIRRIRRTRWKPSDGMPWKAAVDGVRAWHLWAASRDDIH